MQNSKNVSRSLFKGMAIAATLLLAIGDVQARVGGGNSAGSRGSKSYSAPPVTNTAPRQAQPLPGTQAPRAGAPVAGAPAATPSRWNGLLGGLAGGLLGAGLFGMLAGHGLFGGLGSMMSILGLILQAAVVFFIVRFAINYFRRRQAQPAMAGANYSRQPVQPDWVPPQGGAASAPAAAPVDVKPLQIGGEDFSTFERLLGEIQTAHGKGDRIGLVQRTTPEMARILSGELDDLARRGLASQISGVKLLQGDLSEAWSEAEADYATVAMRYAIVDAKVEKATGKVVEGDAARPQEVTEIWTFARRPGEGPNDWLLGAIQQA